jgi:hypothetical protein
VKGTRSGVGTAGVEAKGAEGYKGMMTREEPTRAEYVSWKYVRYACAGTNVKQKRGVSEDSGWGIIVIMLMIERQHRMIPI